MPSCSARPGSGFDGKGGANETAVETSYRIALDRFLPLQPDLQYIVDEGGSEPDSLIATIRLAVDL